MRKELLALACLIVTLPVFAGTQSTGNRPAGGGQGAICMDCDPDDGGGTPPPPPPSAPSAVILHHKVDPATRTVEINFNIGVAVVIDAQLGKVFIAKGGASTETTVDAALLQMANGNAQAASALKNELNALFANPRNLLQLSRQAQSPTMTIETRHSKSRNRSPQQGESIMAGGGFSPYNCYFSWGCHYVPSYIEFGGGGGGWYGFGFTQDHGDYWGGGGDYDDWKRFRDSACSQGQENFEDAGMATGFMAGTCAAAGSGVGLVGCGISGIAVLIFMNRAAQNMKVCSNPYPGPGNW